DWADAVVISVPMHTALRLALEVVEEIREHCPGLPIALVGLYATVAVGLSPFGPRDLLAAGEFEPALADWVDELASGSPTTARGPAVSVSLTAKKGAAAAASTAPAPDRTGLPELARYARLSHRGELVLAGYTETTRGCSHTCRHCPVPTVYDGRTRVVDPRDVLADVATLVEAGAGHVTFGDPDFLNRPAHALEVVRLVHDRFPDLTFDATVKVEHVLRHRSLWQEFGASGCLFVVSALEAVRDDILLLLDKGHTTAESVEALRILRSAGIEPRPSFLPFTPWTDIADLSDLLRFVADNDLVWNVDPVQYGIRLLLPPGSLLLSDPDPRLAASLDGYDAGSLSWRWRSEDPRVDELALEVATIAEKAAADDEEIPATFERIAAAAGAHRASDGKSWTPRQGRDPDPGRPRLTEAWFCCAEPTSMQRSALIRD
ncbi:MAG TPA: radical SAM protein, partial [Acidimicrobiales bacterium]|nr:radical SAM protein [Acidimicrobiales bacterium]